MISSIFPFETGRIIVLRDDRVEEYPLNFPVYADGGQLRPVEGIRNLPGGRHPIGDLAVPVRQSRAWWQYWKK